MMLSGDIVTAGDADARFVVVDLIPEDPPQPAGAVLRPAEDPDGEISYRMQYELTVVGHIESLPGWRELTPGKWVRA